MSEKLISAAALREEMNEYILPLTTNNLMGAADVFHRTAHLLEEAPAVDAVKVVRCKDCKYWVPMDIGGWMTKGRIDGECRLLLDIHSSKMYMTKKDHFCSYGRKERRQ